MASSSRRIYSILCAALAIMSASSVASASTFIGLGALPDPFDDSFHPIVHTPDGLGIVGSACTSDFFSAPCKPFRFVPFGANVELSPLPGDEYGSAWAMTPDSRVVVGLSQNESTSKRGRTAVRWIEAGPALPLASHSESIATWARAVSSDGTIISGHRNQVFDETAFIWTESSGLVELLDPALPQLDQSEWIGQSEAGQVVAMLHRGNTPNSNGPTRAIRWTQLGGLESLGPIPSGYTSSNAVDIAEATGSVVGTLWVADQGTSDGIGYRWTNSAQMDTFPPPPSHLESRALKISKDGATVLGRFESPAAGGLETEAFRWNAADGTVSLGSAPGFERTAPTGMSENGEVIWGSMDSDTFELIFDAANATDVYEVRREKRPFIWTSGNGRVDVPHGNVLLSICDHDFWTQVEDVFADGAVAFGRTRCDEADSFFEYFDPFQGWIVDHVRGATQEIAFAWDPVTGFRTLNTYLEGEQGLDLTGWSIETIEIKNETSENAILYGSGQHNGKSEGWVVFLPEPESGLAIISGVLWLALVARKRNEIG